MCHRAGEYPSCPTLESVGLGEGHVFHLLLIQGRKERTLSRLTASVTRQADELLRMDLCSRRRVRFACFSANAQRARSNRQSSSQHAHVRASKTGRELQSLGVKDFERFFFFFLPFTSQRNPNLLALVFYANDRDDNPTRLHLRSLFPLDACCLGLGSPPPPRSHSKPANRIGRSPWTSAVVGARASAFLCLHDEAPLQITAWTHAMND